MLIKVAWRSLCSRRYTALLALISVAISTFVLLGVEHIRSEAKESFSKTVSGVDLIAGARTSPLNLLLYSIFRIGHPTNNISWHSYRELAGHPKVAWTIPLSLGDSHRGFRVVGTHQDFFTRFRFGDHQPLALADGKFFSNRFDAVLGADAARKLNYRLNDKIVIAHGLGQVSFSLHDNRPFTVSGILQPTGTPVDQGVYISLQDMEAIHLDWRDDVKIPGGKTASQTAEALDLTPKSVTAVLIGLHSKMATFQVQRQINQDTREPLLAILPGATLTELWQMMATLEKTLQLISYLVLFSALLGLSTMLLSSIRERRREIAVMRAIGATPLFIVLLIQLEALFIVLAGIVLAVSALSLSLHLSHSYLAGNYGIFINAFMVTEQIAVMLGIIVAGAFLLALIPSLSAYRQSLHDGLSIRN